MSEPTNPVGRKKMEINIGESSEILKQQVSDSSYIQNVGLDLRKNDYFISFWFMLKIDIDALIKSS